MKKRTLVWFAIGVLASASSLAQNDKDAINKLQSACELKQVTQSCAVSLHEKEMKGRCIDAKQYGLICSTVTQ